MQKAQAGQSTICCWHTHLIDVLNWSFVSLKCECIAQLRLNFVCLKCAALRLQGPYEHSLVWLRSPHIPLSVLALLTAVFAMTDCWSTARPEWGITSETVLVNREGRSTGGAHLRASRQKASPRLTLSITWPLAQADSGVSFQYRSLVSTQLQKPWLPSRNTSIDVVNERTPLIHRRELYCYEPLFTQLHLLM